MPSRKQISSCAENSECVAINKVNKGKYIRVSDHSNCEKNLESDCSLPAVPIQLPTGVEFADGSVKHPLKLNKLQKFQSTKVSNILFQKDDGTISKWQPPQGCGNFKLSIIDGRISVVEDTLPTIISADICDVGCGDVDYLLGIKITQLQCSDGSSRQVAQIRAVPKCCCDADDINALSGLVSGIGE